MLVRPVASSHLFLLTALVVWMRLANQVEIFLIEQSILSLALFSSALLPFATALTAFPIIFFVFIYYESFTNLAMLLEEPSR